MAAALLALGSCANRRLLRQPDLGDMPAAFDDAGFPRGAGADAGWSILYPDTVLQGLIRHALEHNKDLRIAAARVREMVAAKRIDFAGMFPALNAQAYADREYLNYGGRDKKYSPEIHANLSVGWEINFLGKQIWQNRAGKAAYLESVEEQRSLHLTIVASVAQLWFELTALDRKLEITRQTLAARQEQMRFARLRYEGGLTSEIPYRQSLVELARTQTLVPQLEQEIRLKENDLSVLVGDYPGGIPREAAPEMRPITPDIPVGLPSEVLLARPDVAAARQRLDRARAEAGVAYASMFPSLRLTGHLGGESGELSDFLKSPTWFWSGLVTGPLFNMGRNKARHRASVAAYEQEALRYEKTVMDVFREVNNALTVFRKTREIYGAVEQYYNSARQYNELTRLQWVNGVISYLDVLDAQRQLFDAQVALNDAALRERTSVVSLYKALGGGLAE